MKKIKLSPGKTLLMFIEENGLNCNRLANAINMSNAMVRLMIFDKSPISVPAAMRLAKFFKNKTEYWLEVQLQYDLMLAGKDKELTKEISNITDISKYRFVRKPHEPRKPKKTGKKKPTLADKRKAAAKKPGSKPVRGRKNIRRG